MIASVRVVTALILGFPIAVGGAAVARAQEFVTYEVSAQTTSPPPVDVEYTDLGGKVTLSHVTLPWRMNAAVVDPHSADTTLRVTWKPAERYKWINLRIFSRGSNLCERNGDTGNETCTGKGFYKQVIPPFLPPTAPPGADYEGPSLEDPAKGGHP